MTVVRPLACDCIICWAATWLAQVEGTFPAAEPDLPARYVEHERAHIVTLNASS